MYLSIDMSLNIKPVLYSMNRAGWFAKKILITKNITYKLTSNAHEFGKYIASILLRHVQDLSLLRNHAHL